MQTEATDPTPREEVDLLEHEVLDLVLHDKTPGLWTADELGQAIGDQLKAADALAGLHAAGLVHRCGDLVSPSRAAVRAFQLAETL